MRRAMTLVGAALALLNACGGDDGGGKPDAAPGSGPDAATPGGSPDAAGPSGSPDADLQPPENALIAGRVVGQAVPSSGKAMALWAFVDDDLYYKFGEGPSIGDDFYVSVTGDPPESAVGSDGIGVAFVVLVPPGVQAADGLLDFESLDILGIGAQQFLVFKKPGATNTSWSTAFADGYSCGACVPGGGAGGRDGLTPVDCAQVQIMTPPPNVGCEL
jgi:hypothetical protein